VSLLRIATRGSDLALIQARHIAARLEAELGVESELVVLRTTGDRIQNRSLAKIGGKGLFIKEIEEALLDGRADLAVHSAKDVPARIADGCTLAGYPEREDPRDALVGRERGVRLETLRRGARVGTGSTRRIALLRRHRPDLEVVPLRGNVATRIAKMETESLDAVILACAGMDRLGLGDRIDERISPDVMLPAVGQGLLALETRAGDEWAERVQSLESPEIGIPARAERAFQTRLGGDCSVPLAGHAEREADGGLRFRGLVCSADGSEQARAERSGAAVDAEALGAAVAEAVLEAGGDVILRRLADSPEPPEDPGRERGERDG